MLQRQDKYLLHSCNSRLIYQTCGNGFALGSYGILYSANFFFVARSSRIMIPATLFVKSPVESWVLREVLPRDPGHPSFSELQQHVLWRVNAWQIDKLSLTGLIECSRCKKNEKSIWSWMDNFTKWAFRDHSMSVQGRPRSPVEKFQTVYVWVRRVQCACSDQFLSDMHKSMYRKFWFYGHWSKLDKGCLNPVKWNVYISFLNSGKARPKSMFQIFTWNLSNNIFMCIFNMPKHTFITLEIMS